MAEITAEAVRELRAKTDLPLMDCKRALAENDADMEAAFVREPLLREALQDYVERLGEALRAGRRIDAVVADLVRRDAAADAEFEAAAAHLVEHADLVDQSERMIEVEGVDQRAEPQRLRPLRHRRQEDTGRGRHAERRRMMLGQVIGVEARALVEFDEFQAILELQAEIGAGAVHVVEDAELHERFLLM